MKPVTLYFVLGSVMTVWLVYANYSGKVLWGAGGAGRRYLSGYQHK